MAMVLMATPVSFTGTVSKVTFLGVNDLCHMIRSCSLDTKSVPRVSREPFDQESPNFTRTSTPTYSTVTPDMTSLSTSGGKLSRKSRPKSQIRQPRGRFLENGLSKDHEILPA